MKEEFVHQMTSDELSEKFDLPKGVKINIAISNKTKVYWTAFISDEDNNILWWGKNNKFVSIKETVDKNWHSVMYCESLKDLVLSVKTHYKPELSLVEKEPALLN